MSKDSSDWTPTSLSDFSAAVERLDASSANWVIFQNRFLIAVEQKEVLGQFDGTNPKLSALKEEATDSEKKKHAKELTAWQKKESLVKYLLMQKLPDSTFTKYFRKGSVANIWSAIVEEFTEKSMLMRSSLHSEFINMRYEEGADLHAQFDRIRMKYEELMNVGVSVSEQDYHSLVINFVPAKISAFLAHLSASMRALDKVHSRKYKRMGLTSPTGTTDASVDDLDAEDLMQLAIEEWDRHGIRKSKGKGTTNNTSGMALAAVASEKPGAKSGGGKRLPRGVCWTCGEKGHKKDTCLSPTTEDKNKGSSSRDNTSASSSKQRGSNLSSSNPPPYSTTGTSSSKKPKANVAIDDSDGEIEGAWSVVTMDQSYINDYDEDEDMPELETVTEVDVGNIGDIIRHIYRLAYEERIEELESIGIPGVIPFELGRCRAEHDNGLRFDYTDGPSAEGLTVDEDIHVPDWVYAATNKGIGPQWDLYDSGASHHMSPCRDDFVNFREIPPKSLTAANSESFVATGTGDMIIITPYNDEKIKIRLTRVLYTPDVGFTLVSVG
jgi:hypothetical protein